MAETVPKGALNNAQDAVTSVENWSRENHMKLHPGKCRGRTLIGGGCIFIYSGYARLTSFKINFISKETSRAEPEYMNIHPPINVLATALFILEQASF